jgi:iron complex transport system substrate-binding protein
MKWLPFLLLIGCERPTVRVDRPQRIVSLTVSTSEMLIDLVVPDRIAAVHVHAMNPQFSLVPGKFKGLRMIEADIESIVALKPDLVTIATHSPKELVEHLRRAGIPMFVEEGFDGIESILRNYDRLAEAVGEKPRRVRIEPAQVGPKRVMSYLQGGWTAGRGTIFDSMLRALGAVNAADVDGFAAVSKEHLIKWKPDVLVVPPGVRVEGYRCVELSEAHLAVASHWVAESLDELSRRLRE